MVPRSTVVSLMTAQNLVPDSLGEISITPSSVVGAMYMSPGKIGAGCIDGSVHLMRCANESPVCQLKSAGEPPPACPRGAGVNRLASPSVLPW